MAFFLPLALWMMNDEMVNDEPPTRSSPTSYTPSKSTSNNCTHSKSTPSNPTLSNSVPFKSTANRSVQLNQKQSQDFCSSLATKLCSLHDAQFEPVGSDKPPLPPLAAECFATLSPSYGTFDHTNPVDKIEQHVQNLSLEERSKLAEEIAGLKRSAHANGSSGYEDDEETLVSKNDQAEAVKRDEHKMSNTKNITREALGHCRNDDNYDVESATDRDCAGCVVVTCAVIYIFVTVIFLVLMIFVFIMCVLALWEMSRTDLA